MKTYNNRQERDAQVAAGKICSGCFRAKCPSFNAKKSIVVAKASARSKA